MHTKTPSAGALLLGLVALLFAPLCEGAENTKKIQVDAYKKKDGTTVKAHERTAPNNTKNDNLSAKENRNHAGKSGIKSAERETISPTRPAATQPSATSAKSSPTRQTRQLSIVDEHPQPRQRTHAELLDTVARCNRLLDSYIRAPFGQSPFNAERYEQIRLERDTAQGELNAGR